MLILAEADTQPLTEGKRIMAPEYAPGWTTLWAEYRRGLAMNGFDTSIPTRLRGLLQEIPSMKDSIVAQEALVPSGESVFPPGAPLHRMTDHLSSCLSSSSTRFLAER